MKRSWMSCGLVLVALALGAGCESETPPWAGGGAGRAGSGAADAGAAVVATVDGVGITGADLQLAMATAARASDPHQPGAGPATPPDRAAVLDTLIDQELEAREAEARGLDDDPDYRAELARMEAEVAAFRRQRLARLAEHDASQRAQVSEADARRFFDERADRIRTQVHVEQILLHDPDRIADAKAKLDAGEPFEAVATWSLPVAPPAGSAPWDLGYLAWNQVPEPWLPALDALKVGETSGVIEGPRGRRWIIRLLDRRVDPAITFETARPAIMLLLGSQAADAAVDRLKQGLRASAVIERTP
ncbi:MAG TPA: peptidylprolyl isomerase [Kofleriaceae bacterium]|nr:peptidylprolyl isomerase [Kofleriaceae bacterium]